MAGITAGAVAGITAGAVASAAMAEPLIAPQAIAGAPAPPLAIDPVVVRTPKGTALVPAYEGYPPLPPGPPVVYDPPYYGPSAPFGPMGRPMIADARRAARGELSAPPPKTRRAATLAATSGHRQVATSHHKICSSVALRSM